MKVYKSENAKKKILDHVADTAYYVLPPSSKRGTGYGARIWGTVCWVFIRTNKPMGRSFL